MIIQYVQMCTIHVHFVNDSHWIQSALVSLPYSLPIVLKASLHPVKHNQSIKYMRQSLSEAECLNGSTSLDYTLIYVTTLDDQYHPTLF